MCVCVLYGLEVYMQYTNLPIGSLKIYYLRGGL